MKASALFGADWADDSLEVLWRDAGRDVAVVGAGHHLADRVDLDARQVANPLLASSDS